MNQLTAAGNRYPIDAILFDKDGTLIDFIFTWGRWSEHMLEAFANQLEAKQLPPMQLDMATLWGTRHASNGEIIDYDRNGPLAMGTIDDLIAVLAWQGYLAGMSWAEAKLAVQQCRQYADAQLHAARAAKALPGVIPFLEQCRENGLILAVVTADETDAAVKQLEWLGLTSYFAACIGTDQVERGKPFPDMVELACSRLSLSPSRVAVIGDTNGDMKMAKFAGAAVAIGIASDASDGARAKLSDADAVIVSMSELELRKQL
ncbi:HAD family hydrolase [Paenibacillus sp. CF384]|uniref:HAD family hydrolase n=1 Tax=Paenibacillus sp. CF384 TaxID=1884382 RepID=UPI000896D394|nr:HAD family hydrolase [Paenibacillus sp. CF384]SDX33758.1 phosphoglycolate phosphatase [Paenibacillus sp. CF384]